MTLDHVALDRLRSLVDLPGVRQVLDGAAGSADPGPLLAWYANADRVVAQEVAAGRAAAGDARLLQQEVLDLVAEVPGLQFATNEPFGLPDGSH